MSIVDKSAAPVIALVPLEHRRELQERALNRRLAEMLVSGDVDAVDDYIVVVRMGTRVRVHSSPDINGLSVMGMLELAKMGLVERLAAKPSAPPDDPGEEDEGA